MSTTSSINLINPQIDVGTIVDNLIYVDSAPVRLLQSRTTTLQSKISAFQGLNTKISTVLDRVQNALYSGGTVPLLSPYTFTDRLASSIFTKGKVDSSDDSKVSATASNVTSAGSYSINVTGLAQAKSMVSSNFAGTNTTQTGTGTLIITTGSNSPVTVNISSSNSTLSGVCNAINAANAGVTATIINDGTSNPYRLLITANDTGTANAFTVTDNLSGGQALNITQKQAAANAEFSVNGVDITKSSNTVSDVISGVTFTLKAQTTSAVTLNVGHDIDSIISSLQDLVTAYNDVNSFINSQFTYNSTTKAAGVLAGDSTLRTIQSNLQSKVVQLISNRYTAYSIANQIGLEFNSDGSLTLDEATLRSALSSNFTGVAALLLGDGTPADSATASDNRVTYNSKTMATQAGTYDVAVTALAQQASAVGSETVTNLSADETLTINYGALSANAILSQNDSLTMVLSKINSALSDQGIAATATDDGTGKIKISTNGYGSAESISVVSNQPSGPGSTGFGTSPVVGTGVDIAGTINGNAALGSGLTLTGAAGQPEEGLSLIISQTTTGSYGSVTVAPATEGVEGSSILMNLQSLLDGIADPLSGPIHNATDSINQNITAINDQISAYQDRLDKEREMLTAEYNQADQALRMLQLTQASITSQIASIA